MASISLEEQADSLVHKVMHYLMTKMGVSLEEASDEEIFRAFSLALREEIMINWTATAHTLQKCNPRTLYYLCMEYLPGRFLGTNICNMHSEDLIQIVIKKLKLNFERILNIEHDPALGNGGLGRLASCLLDSLATQQYPAMAYGLRYQYGIFHQEIWDGTQVERPENWLLNENPWEFRRDSHAVNILYGGKAFARKNDKGEEIYDLSEYDEVRALAYDVPIVGYREGSDFSVLSLRLWTTKESPRNFQLQRYNAGMLDQAAENTAITDVLYPNDNNDMGKRMRLKQEYLLAAASLADITSQFYRSTQNMQLFADKVRIHMNDTHPTIVVAELMLVLMKDFQFTWKQAFETVCACCNYTNHTVLRESLEEWNKLRFSQLLPRQYRIIERLNADFCQTIRAKFPKDEERVRRMSILEDGQLRMAHLAIYGSYRVNGVALLHSEILKQHLFKDFYELYPEKFTNVTNGVTQRRWLNFCNPRLAEFITKRIGKGWVTDFKAISQLSQFAKDPLSQKEFLEIKRENKKEFSAFVQEFNPLRDKEGNFIAPTPAPDPDALFDVIIKRIHEYKRQLMVALHVILLMKELESNPQSHSIKRVVIVGGKAAPGYLMAKHIIRLIYRLARKIDNHAIVREKLQLIYYENYNAYRAEKIIPAADLSEQISCAGMEASGTGNMKMSMNGALTIGTEDGANIEMHKAITDQWWPFGFGSKSEENFKMAAEGSYHPKELYEKEPRIKTVVDALRDRSIAETEEEHEAFCMIYHSLIPQDSHLPLGRVDPYFVLHDFLSYLDTQKKVENLFLQPPLWAEYAIQNIAHMGSFSTDESVHKYAQLIWGLTPCPVDKEELAKIRKQYREYDKCRIF